MQEIIEILYGDLMLGPILIYKQQKHPEELLTESQPTATFNVSVGGYAYGATITNARAGYAVGDTIKFLGTALGGTTPK